MFLGMMLLGGYAYCEYRPPTGSGSLDVFLGCGMLLLAGAAIVAEVRRPESQPTEVGKNREVLSVDSISVNTRELVCR